MVGVPNEDRPAGGEGKEIRSGIGGFLGDAPPVGIEGNPIQDDEASSLVGIAGHKGFREKVKGGAIDDHPRLSYGIDQGPSGGVSEHVNLAAFRAVHEGLPDVSMDHKLSGLQDLAKLVLAVAVDLDLKTVKARAQIVARGPVGVDPDALGVRSEGTA